MRREIEEELGYRADRSSHIATFYVSPGGSSERIWLYYAEVSEATASRPAAAWRRARGHPHRLRSRSTRRAPRSAKDGSPTRRPSSGCSGCCAMKRSLREATMARGESSTRTGGARDVRTCFVIMPFRIKKDPARKRRGRLRRRLRRDHQARRRVAQAERHSHQVRPLRRDRARRPDPRAHDRAHRRR